MSKIKLSVVKFEKAAVIQILEMDERFRSLEDAPPNTFCTRIKNQSVTIASALYPEIEQECGSIVFNLRGEDCDEDLLPATFICESNAKRDEILLAIYEALRQWADEWEGFSDNSSVKVDKYPKPEIETFEIKD